MSTETTTAKTKETIPLVTRPTNSGRVGTDVPYEEKETHYYWASDNRINQQSVWAMKIKGYRLTDPSKAEQLGLDGYVDAATGELTTVDVNNAIRYGDLLLMECTSEQYKYNQQYKRNQFDAFEGTVRDKAEEDIDRVRSEYQRQKRS